MWKSGIKWMFLIIGTMIGAGYASGRELWQFFGHESGLAIILFTIFFILAVYITMHVSYKYQTSNYFSVLEIIVGRKVARFYDVLIFFYLLSTTVIMVAGSGATFEAFQLPKWTGIVFMAGFIVLIFMRGIRGVLMLNSIILPLLIVGLIALLLFFTVEQNLHFMIDIHHQSNWSAAFTFTALNILSIIAVISAVGEQIKSKGEIWIASVGSGLILGITSFLYNNSLVQLSEVIILYEIPLFAILKNYPAFTYVVMSILLWFAIFTTAISGVLGIATRLKSLLTIDMWKLVAILMVIVIPLTSIGFSTLIAWLYPLYGLINLYLLLAIFLVPFLRKH
ncbi:hypothetical protein J416_13384 [Gracilibacillus halophilus YIM-C55.5]|uniref:Membrane protein YkvI n=1 Tax=Gracilibacillus halophilus YIM-C55.5 TaxID=1308866 RepID=N4W6X7_9BACI|nr:hypothetical protein [Gracilibacillus halophilus]ENH95973.1 hypothetical protein J416_13384 [Gracilibacillus halophilus YIM-C55.5]